MRVTASHTRSLKRRPQGLTWLPEGAARGDIIVHDDRAIKKSRAFGAAPVRFNSLLSLCKEFTPVSDVRVDGDITQTERAVLFVPHVHLDIGESCEFRNTEVC